MKKFTAKVATLALSALIGFTGVLPAQALELPRIPAKVVSEAATDAGNLVEVQHNAHRRRPPPPPHRGYGNPRRGPERGYYGHGYNQRRGYYRGYRGYHNHRPGYRYHDGYWYPLAAFAAGAIIGGAIASQPPVTTYQPGYSGSRYAYSGSHYAWCENRYRSYRVYDNTYQPYNGPRRQCISPY